MLLNLDDRIASALVRTGMAAPFDPGETAALNVGGALSAEPLIDATLQVGSQGRTVRLPLPLEALRIAAAISLAAPVSGILPGPAAPIAPLAALIKPYAAPIDPTAVMSSPPTITTSGTIPSSTTYPATFPSSSTPTKAEQDLYFQQFGGFPILNSSGYQRVFSALSDPTVYAGPTDPAAAGWAAGASAFVAITNASRMVFQCSKVSSATQKFRIRVDGVLATVTPTSQASGANVFYAEIDFGSSALRRVEIESENAWGVRRIYVPAGATVTAPIILPADPRVTLVGNSFAEGPTESVYAGGVKMDGMAWQFRLLAGLTDLRIAGLGGTGFLTGNPAGRANAYSDAARIADALNCSPDGAARSAWAPQALIYWDGGINDFTNGGGAARTPSEIAGAAVSTVQQLRAHVSGRGATIPIFITGFIPRAADASTTGKKFADVQAGESATFAALAGLNDKRLGLIPVSTDPAGAWISPANSGTYIAADGTHLASIAANFYLAQKLADGVSVAAAAMQAQA